MLDGLDFPGSLEHEERFERFLSEVVRNPEYMGLSDFITFCYKSDFRDNSFEVQARGIHASNPDSE